LEFKASTRPQLTHREVIERHLQQQATCGWQPNPGQASAWLRGRPRHVPLDDEALTFLRSLTSGRRPRERLLLRADGKPWDMSHQLRPIAEASGAVRLEPAPDFHALRHTWTSHRVMAGAPPIVLIHVLRHIDTRMVRKHYCHLAPGYIRDVIRATALRIEVSEEAARAMPV
jgi:integrase